MKRKTIAVVLALVLVAGAFAAALSLRASSSGAISFPDVQNGDWYYGPVMSLVELSIVNGMPDGVFEPDGTLTHGQFLKMLACAFYAYAVPLEANGVMFTPGGGVKEVCCWAEPYWHAAVAVGVLAGEGECSESYLEGAISRYDVSLMLVRAAELVLSEKKVDTDKAAAMLSEKVPEQYLYAVAQSYGKGFVGGYEDGTFRGDNTLTRAEAATVIYRLIFPEKRIDTGLEEIGTAQPVPHPSAAPAKDGVVDESWFANAVFLGDSLTDGFRSYSGLETDCLCSSGSTVSALMGRAPSYLGGLTVREALAMKSYGKVFIMLGINESGAPTDEFIAGYEEFIDDVLSIQPEADIYVQSILPVTKLKDSSGTFTIANVQRLNTALKEMCARRGFVYVDLYSELVDSEGYLPASLSWDGIHLEAETYTLWRDLLIEILSNDI